MKPFLSAKNIDNALSKQKINEVKLDEVKLDEVKLDEVKLDEVKLDEVQLINEQTEIKYVANNKSIRVHAFHRR